MKTYLGGLATVRTGHVLDCLRAMPDESVDCIVTSPPYHALRDYGVEGQIGLETTVEEWIEVLAEVFTEVKRVLKTSGTLWVEMGDNYVDKQLTGQPWLLAFRLKALGLILRRDVILRKTKPMPESAKDRFTTAHCYLFHFTKSDRYFFDHEAVMEPVSGTANPRGSGVNKKASGWDTSTGEGGHGTIHKATKSVDMGGKNSKFRVSRNPGGGTPQSEESRLNRAEATERMGRGPGWRNKQNESFSSSVNELVESRYRRSVVDVGIAPFAGAHFATFSPEIPKLCILAGCPVGGVVLDIFAGSGTTLQVAVELGRIGVGIELNPEYVKLIEKRLSRTQPPLGLEESA